jgi:hypothetical protein
MLEGPGPAVGWWVLRCGTYFTSIDGQVHLVRLDRSGCLVRLQSENFRLFSRQQTYK